MSYQDIRHQIANNGYNVRDEFKSYTIPMLQEAVENDRLPYCVAMLNITGDLNVGTMIRTSHCLGAEKVLVFGRRAVDSRSLVGVQNYFKIEKYAAMKSELDIDEDYVASHMRDNSLLPVFVEHGGETYHQVNWKKLHDETVKSGKKLCFVFGNEGMGIPSSLMKKQKIVSIPQRGVTRSFNVSAACAIVLAEFSKIFQ